MSEPTSVRPWARIAARVAGVWILAGCVLKALLGTPADLPSLVRSVPLPLGTTFALVLGIEAFTGLATILRPGRFWPLAALLLAGFALVLGTQVAAGASSCGCFGATISVPPAVMLGIDVAVLLLLLVARPWRLARGGRSDLVVGLVALGAAVLLPLLANREVRLDDLPGKVAPGAKVSLSGYAVLNVKDWKGKALSDTPLAKVLDLSEAQDGLWVFYRLSCEICADCLRTMSILEQGGREVTLVLIPEKPGTAAHVHDLPRGSFFHRKTLPDGVDWVLGTPARLLVEHGVVTEAGENLGPNDCR